MNNEQIEELFYRTPFNRHFDFHLISRNQQSVTVSIAPIPDYVQEKGLIHGGVLTSLADTAAVYIFIPDLQPGETVTSIEFKMNFLRPALLPGGEITAISKLIQRGRKIGFCEVEVMQANKLIAKGTFTYLFFTA